MKTGLVVMTAMPPTKGHGYLIDFAASFMAYKGGRLIVMVCSRDIEPISGHLRYSALEKFIKDNSINNAHIILDHAEDFVPQNPSEHPDFWNWWKNRIETVTERNKFDFVFASEKYGTDLAKILNATYIPCDINREVVLAKANWFRTNPIECFDILLPQIKPYYKRTITVFGAESCGKTTMAANLAGKFNCTYVHEWARQYLETVGAEVTDEKMRNIVAGQLATQLAVRGSKTIDKPLVIQDTDLYSTLGYYRIYAGSAPLQLASVADIVRSDLYILMNDKIPFTPDVLRYGGDKRESDMKFWLDILEEFDLNYYVVKSTDEYEQYDEVVNFVKDWYKKECGSLELFQRT